jgi:hypothetical protein
LGERDYKFALPPPDQITKLLATLKRPVNREGGIKWMLQGPGMDAFGVGRDLQGPVMVTPCAASLEHVKAGRHADPHPALGLSRRVPIAKQTR